MAPLKLFFGITRNNIRDKSLKEGISRHATFIIDQKGIVRAKLFQVSYAGLPAVDALIKAIRESR